MVSAKVKKEQQSELPERPPSPTRSSSIISIASSTNTIPTTAAVTSASAASSATMAGTKEDVEMADSATTEAALKALGKESRVLIEAMQRIELLNIVGTLPPLPKIVVIGDQSAGKSSVIEAACDITLPRSGGTCTRCPFLITTTAAQNGEPWSCEITLQLKYCYYRGMVGQSSEFDHWMPQQEMVTKDFGKIWNKSDLELALRRAQLALLNPNNEHTRYLKLAAPALGREELQVDFSPNVISLKITGENLPELSLYDLPGAVNSLGNEDQQYLVHFVEKLIKVYICDTSAIILLACAANQDLETSTAYRYLTDCKGGRQRTIGVLTKPDLVETTTSKIEYLQLIVDGGKFSVGHGWHVTRQLSQSELDRGLSYDEARRIEANFFNKAPWAHLTFPPGCFGIPNLQKALSKLLTVEIIRAIPSISANARHRIADIQERLQKLSVKTTAPAQSVCEEAEKVARALREELDIDSNKPFRKEYRKVFSNFWMQVKGSKPTVVLSTPGYERPTILLDSDELDDTPSKIRKTDCATPKRAPTCVRTPATERRRRRTPAPSTEPAPTCSKAVFHLDNVKIKYDLAAGAVLGGSLDSKVTRQLILSTINVWKTLVENLLRNVNALFDKLLDGTTQHVLASRRSQEIFKETLHMAKSLLALLIEEQKQQTERFLAWEQVRPITYNSAMLAEKKRTYEADLRKRRDDQRLVEHYETMEAEGYSVPKPDNRKKAGDMAAVNMICGGPDPYDRELSAEALPAILAYYDVAAMSFVDSLAKSLEYLLFLPFQDRIHAQLIHGLQVGNAEYCARLLADDPQREVKRAQLLHEEASLQKAIEELQSLPGFGA